VVLSFEEALVKMAACESCGRDDEDLEMVHRVYLLVGDDGEDTVSVVPERERWCPSCRATYPHRVP
jgi:hypothetical protein